MCEHLISQLEKVRAAYHKSCQKEQTALDKEKQANEDAEMSPEKKRKITCARESATEQKELVSGVPNTLHSRTSSKPGSICKPVSPSEGQACGIPMTYRQSAACADIYSVEESSTVNTSPDLGCLF